jgi:hypothetical protein
MSLGALSASIAHEINQPLTGIMANAGTSLRTLAADPPDLEGARDAMQRTLRDAKRASEVVGRLRALFSKKPPSADPVDLNDAAGEVLSLSAASSRAARPSCARASPVTCPSCGATGCSCSRCS